MSRPQITLGLRSSSGRKRMQISPTASASGLRNAIQRELGLEEDFVTRRDKNGRPGDELRLTSRGATVSSLKINNGDVLYITPVAGTRFKARTGHDRTTLQLLSTRVVIHPPLMEGPWTTLVLGWTRN